MNIFLTLLQVFLAGMFLMVGVMKLMKSKEQLAMKMGWVNDYSQGQIRGIALLEILAAIGLVVPHLTGIMPILTPLAAVGIVLLMLGAMKTHMRRGEKPMLRMNMMILAAALVVAVGRLI